MGTFNFELLVGDDFLVEFIVDSIKGFTRQEFYTWLDLDVAYFPKDELVAEYRKILVRLEEEEMFEECAILRDHIKDLS